MKKIFGQGATVLKEMPPIDREGKLILEPAEIIDVWEKKLRSRTFKEYLMQWKDVPIEDATWEGGQILEHPSLQLHESKKFLGTKDCNVPKIIK